MKEVNRLAAVIICCMAFVAKSATAFWPVTNFPEMPSSFKRVKEGVDNFKTTMEQLKELNTALKGVKGAVSNVAEFGQSLAAPINAALDTAGDVAGAVKEGTGVDVSVPSDITDAIEDALDAQKGVVDGLTGSVNDVLDQVNDTTNKGSGYVDEADKVTKDVDDFFNKNKKKSESDNSAGANTSTEEEEEEEEVEVTVSDSLMADVQKELAILFKTTKDESADLHMALNDALESSLSVLNKNAETNKNALASLAVVIRDSTAVSEEDRETLLKEIDAVTKKQQKLSETAIRFVEDAKDRYNREYKNKIKDGINNYEKIVTAYLNKDASIEEVMFKEKQLREDMAAIKPIPDKAILNTLGSSAAIIAKDLDQLKKNIEMAVKNHKEASNKDA